MTEFRGTDKPTPPTASARPALACRVYQDFSRLDYLRTEWDHVVQRTCGCVYMTYDWVRVWWSFYGETAALRLFVLSAGDRIEAVVPIYVDTLGWGPLRLRVARLVGANIPPKVFGLAVPEWCATEVFGLVMAQLFGKDDCDLLSLGPVSEDEHWTGGLHAACRQGSSLFGLRDLGQSVYSVFHLPANMSEYYSALGKSSRRNRRKHDLRLIKKEHDTHVRVVTERALLSEEFEGFAEQHRQQWLAEGRTGHFGAWPRALDFHRALVEAQGKWGRPRFIRIMADGQMIANQYAFIFGDRCYWELPSRAVGPQWDRLSLGPTGIVTMIEHAISEGITRVEGGLGHYDYKVRLGAQEHSAQTFRVVASRLASRARLALFSAVRSCLAISYHKLWYRRVAPRLPPVFWRPQWRVWLRLDF